MNPLLHTDIACSPLVVKPAFMPFGYTHCVPRGGVGFQGQWRDGYQQGYLLGNGHRMLLPTHGRFTRQDSLSPFGRGGLNSYSYCAADPINHSDPSGAVFSALRRTLRDAYRQAVGWWRGHARLPTQELATRAVTGVTAIVVSPTIFQAASWAARYPMVAQGTTLVSMTGGALWAVPAIFQMLDRAPTIAFNYVVNSFRTV